jgi:PAS domain S-box-containing protein
VAGPAAKADDPARLAALASYGILDTGREPAFDDIADLAAELLDAPIAVVNLIAADRQWFKAERGIGVCEMPLDVSICRHVFLRPGVTVVPDLRDDGRFAGNPLVAAAGGLRFYAGAALRSPEGWSLGTVCVLDVVPRPAGLPPRLERVLRSLAAQVMAQLEARRAAAEAREEGSRFRALFEQSAVGALHADLDGRWTLVNRRMAEMLGHAEPSELVGSSGIELTHPGDRDEDRVLLARLAAGEAPFYQRTKRYLRRDGSSLPVAITVSLIRDMDGTPTHCSALVEDLSERRKAEAAAGAAARRSAFFLDLETRLREAGGPDGIVAVGAEAIARQIGVARVGMGEVDARATHFVIRRDWHDLPLGSVAGTWRMADFGPALIAAIRAGRTVAIPDVACDPLTDAPSVAASFAAIGVRSLVAVPLLRDGNLAAMLFIHHPEPRPWTDDELATVQEASARIWAASDRARAESIEAEQTRLLEMIAAGRPLSETLAAVTDLVTRLEPSARAAVLLTDAGRFAFESAIAARIPAAFGAALAGARIEELAIGTCGTAVHRGEPVICADIANEAGWAPHWRELCLGMGFRAVHSEPVSGADGVTVASLALYLDAARHPTLRESQVARFAARLAAVAVERERADRALRVQAAHQGCLFRLLEAQRRIDDPGEILRTGAETVGRQLGADRAGFFEVTEGEILAFARGWGGEALPPLSGTVPAAALGTRMRQDLRAGRTSAFADAARDAEAPPAGAGAGAAAGIGAPIIRDGRWLAGLAVHAAAPRVWTAGEITLVRDVADQTWDAVERARAETAQRESESRLRLATEAAELGFWDLDVLNDILVWPPRVRAMFGISRDAPVSMRDFEEGLHPDDREATVAAYAAAADPARRILYDVEYRTVGKEDGVLRWVAAKGRGVFDAEGRCVRMVGTAVDITARRRAEEALAHSRRELQQLNDELERRVSEEVAAREAAQAQLAHAQRMEALGQLAGGIAHDFNNVLQAVQGGARLIQAEPGDAARARRLATMIADAAGRGASVTRRLLAFSRRGDLRAEPVEPAGLLRDLRDILVHTLGAGIRVRVQVPPGLPALLADKGQLETVLVNLAANARDAMGGAGELSLSAAVALAGNDGSGRLGTLQSGSYVRLSVSDTGLGMDAATLARASEPFFTTKPPGRGTGLGLAMARGFAEQSSGALEIESAPGRGTTVRLWFPVAEQAGIEAEAAHVAPAPAPEGSPRLLLVDDEALVREITAQGLEAAGFTVLSVGTSPEALELLRGRERVDLLVSDLSMPDLDGLTLITEAQRLRPGLPAILLTGFATDAAELAMSGAISGSFSLIRKPVEAQALAERAAVLLT